MPRHRYRYPFASLPFNDHISTKARPFIPVNIVNPFTGEEILWWCLMDTGADACLFSSATASITGHNLDGDGVERTVSTGIAGVPLICYRHTFVLQLMHPVDHGRVLWQSQQVQVECAEESAGFQQMLLGHDNFLCNFRVVFDYPKDCAVLEWCD